MCSASARTMPLNSPAAGLPRHEQAASSATGNHSNSPGPARWADQSHHTKGAPPATGTASRFDRIAADVKAAGQVPPERTETTAPQCFLWGSHSAPMHQWIDRADSTCTQGAGRARPGTWRPSAATRLICLDRFGQTGTIRAFPWHSNPWRLKKLA